MKIETLFEIGQEIVYQKGSNSGHGMVLDYRIPSLKKPQGNFCQIKDKSDGEEFELLESALFFDEDEYQRAKENSGKIFFGRADL